MKTPYETLEVAEQATDSEIKQAYLQKVKLNPPDRDHEKFQQIHSAYESIKDVTSREKYALFNYPEADFNALLDQAFIATQPSLMSADHFDKLLRASIDDKTFLIGRHKGTNNMSDAQKNRLLEEFQTYLEQTDLAQALSAEQPDLSTLLSEMAGLKSEVKAEARHFKATLDTLGDALTAQQTDNKALADELAAHNERLQQMRSETLRTVLLDIVDIYDRLSVGFGILQNYNPVLSLFGHSAKQDVRLIESLKEGQSMTLKRFEQLLQRHHVYAIDCVGKLLDPRTMSAVEISQDSTLDNGIVVEELRKGFLFEKNVLRLAEVKVNKL